MTRKLTLCIAGSRTVDCTPEWLVGCVEHVFGTAVFDIGRIIHGACPRGIDRAAARMLVPLDHAALKITVEAFPAEWDKWGKAAGTIRNARMARVADAVLVVWDGKSPGSRDMVACAATYGTPCWQYVVPAGQGVLGGQGNDGAVIAPVGSCREQPGGGGIVDLPGQTHMFGDGG